LSHWSAGYVDEIGYIHGYYPEMSPGRLAFSALTRGLRHPRPDQPLAYCDLGCGQGFSTNLLAAAHPHIQFYATDFNPAQIAGARALADECGLVNAHFADDSFAEYLERPDLPMFDIIALQGIYTWVAPEHRATVVEFIRRRLKVGGLVYISYNVLPGWSAVMPLRALLAEHAGRGAGPLAQRMEEAFAFASRLAGAGAAYFANTPAAAQRLEQLKGQNRSYVAHEYFNRHWRPHYFADVARELAEAKLTYLGSAHVLDHVPDLSLSRPHQALLAEVADPVYRETLRDYLTMQIFRRDVFVKGALPLPAPDLAEAWSELRLALAVPRGEAMAKALGELGEVKLDPDSYEPILEVLADGPQSVRRLREDPRIAPFSRPRLEEALTVLVGTGVVHPCLPEEGEAARRKRTRAFNTAVTRRAETSTDYQFLASPAAGTGCYANRFVQLFLHALNAGEADVPAAVWRRLEAGGHQVMVQGRVLETAEENLAELRRRFEAFAPQIPVLQGLGIAEAEPAARLVAAAGVG
jgi:SAM-dependent methyltransferase